MEGEIWKIVRKVNEKFASFLKSLGTFPMAALHKPSKLRAQYWNEKTNSKTRNRKKKKKNDCNNNDNLTKTYSVCQRNGNDKQETQETQEKQGQRNKWEEWATATEKEREKKNGKYVTISLTIKLKCKQLRIRKMANCKATNEVDGRNILTSDEKQVELEIRKRKKMWVSWVTLRYVTLAIRMGIPIGNSSLW